MATLKVRIVRGFCIAAGRDVFPGDVVELAEAEARLRIAQGKAAPAEKTTEAEAGPEDADASGLTSETVDPAVKSTKGRGR